MCVVKHGTYLQSAEARAQEIVLLAVLINSPYRNPSLRPTHGLLLINRACPIDSTICSRFILMYWMRSALARRRAAFMRRMNARLSPSWRGLEPPTVPVLRSSGTGSPADPEIMLK